MAFHLKASLLQLHVARCQYVKTRPWVQLSDSEAEKRVQWVKGMRKVLSPPEMINADGSVNQDFFKPKKVQSCHLRMMAALAGTST